MMILFSLLSDVVFGQTVIPGDTCVKTGFCDTSFLVAGHNFGSVVKGCNDSSIAITLPNTQTTCGPNNQCYYLNDEDFVNGSPIQCDNSPCTGPGTPCVCNKLPCSCLVELKVGFFTVLPCVSQPRTCNACPDIPQNQVLVSKSACDFIRTTGVCNGRDTNCHYQSGIDGVLSICDQVGVIQPGDVSHCLVNATLGEQCTCYKQCACIRTTTTASDVAYCDATPTPAPTPAPGGAPTPQVTPSPTPLPPPPPPPPPPTTQSPTPAPTPIITGSTCVAECPVQKFHPTFLQGNCELLSQAPGLCRTVSNVLTCVYLDSATLASVPCFVQAGDCRSEQSPCTCHLPANFCGCVAQNSSGAYFTTACVAPTHAPTPAPTPVPTPGNLCAKTCALNVDNTCQKIDVTFAAATCQKQRCRSVNVIADVDVDCISQGCFGNQTFNTEGEPCTQCDCACTNQPEQHTFIGSDSSSSSFRDARKRRERKRDSSDSSSSSSSSDDDDDDVLVVRDCFTEKSLPATNTHEVAQMKKGKSDDNRGDGESNDDGESSFGKQHQRHAAHHNAGKHQRDAGPCKLCKTMDDDNFWFYCDADECELRYNISAWVVIGVIVLCCFVTCMWTAYFAWHRRYWSVSTTRAFVARPAHTRLPNDSLGEEIPRVV